MPPQPQPRGIHHITAIAGDPGRNLTFYRDLLGLRLVKKTVNFDDPFTYHFYFADEGGTPGTILTFFPWLGARAGRTGAGMIESIAFAVPADAMDFWRERLARADVTIEEHAPVFGESGICFADPDGLQLELVAVEPACATRPWDGAVPADKAIRALHSATQRVRDFEPTEHFLRNVLGFERVGEDAFHRRYRTAQSGIGFLDVVADSTAEAAQGGRGTVHHIAWATEDLAANEHWRERLRAAGADVSPVRDRTYFQSIYFREPGGVLFEFATRGPGFATDEPAAQLGSALKLPPQFEEHRARIEEALPRLPE